MRAKLAPPIPLGRRGPRSLQHVEVCKIAMAGGVRGGALSLMMRVTGKYCVRAECETSTKLYMRNDDALNRNTLFVFLNTSDCFS